MLALLVSLFSVVSFSFTTAMALYKCSHPQWRSQDEQVMWAQHGHIQCVRKMHLLGKLGHAPAKEISERF